MVQFPQGAELPVVEVQYSQLGLLNIWEPIFLGLPHPNVSGCQAQKPNTKFTVTYRKVRKITVLKELHLEGVSEIQTLDNVANVTVIAVAK